MSDISALHRLKDDTSRRLKSYRIIQLGCRYVVIRKIPTFGDREDKVTTDLFEAVEFLLSKLPPITEPRDITRQTP